MSFTEIKNNSVKIIKKKIILPDIDKMGDEIHEMIFPEKNIRNIIYSYSGQSLFVLRKPIWLYFAITKRLVNYRI